MSALLQVRIDETLKKPAQETAKAMGLDLTSVIRMCLTQMVNLRKLPFTPTADSFYSKANREALDHSIWSLNNEEKVTKTMQELRALEE